MPALAVSLRESGKSRADLWQYAANIALETEIERANFGCDYDFNTGNQVRLYFLSRVNNPDFCGPGQAARGRGQVLLQVV